MTAYSLYILINLPSEFQPECCVGLIPVRDLSTKLLRGKSHLFVIFDSTSNKFHFNWHSLHNLWSKFHWRCLSKPVLVGDITSDRRSHHPDTRKPMISKVYWSTSVLHIWHKTWENRSNRHSGSTRSEFLSAYGSSLVLPTAGTRIRNRTFHVKSIYITMVLPCFNQSWAELLSLDYSNVLFND